ncbi:hypothetical protein OUZ56_000828 [Daphnia magna]|uniref:Uncharacterized protein n=1 Tax=Daphnia magna TaxID=35525 RepID=A0ABR0A0V3_9CRUS|nr:hypothetical protein OUZ56_000828 [Daphnia magna]
MKFTIVLACLLVLTVATEVKSESEKSVSPDQDFAESYRGGFYGGYGGYWRGRRSAEGKPEKEANDETEVDREAKDEVEVDQETKDEVEVDRKTKDEVEVDQETKDEVEVDRKTQDEVEVAQEAKDEIEVDQEPNEYRRGYYGGYGALGRGRRSAEELKNAQVDQEANEFRRGYYGGYHGQWRGRRSVEEMIAAMNVPVYSDQDASEWHARRYYGRPYTYRGY